MPKKAIEWSVSEAKIDIYGKYENWQITSVRGKQVYSHQQFQDVLKKKKKKKSTAEIATRKRSSWTEEIQLALTEQMNIVHGINNYPQTKFIIGISEKKKI